MFQYTIRVLSFWPRWQGKVLPIISRPKIHSKKWLEGLSLKAIYQLLQKLGCRFCVTGKKKEGGIVFWMTPTWRSCFRYFFLKFFCCFFQFFWHFYLRIVIIVLLKVKAFFKVLNTGQQTHEKWFFDKWYSKCAWFSRYFTFEEKLALWKFFLFSE